jgi:hypothetical protein
MMERDSFGLDQHGAAAYVEAFVTHLMQAGEIIRHDLRRAGYTIRSGRVLVKTTPKDRARDEQM